ncbi:hypothetical protein HBA54_04295 [Pelagibius litoralis]|uniref:Uncharacterized protein n=1 Tax=Pelagibius litoralis TaxID=374515 RepID=A0A967EWQ3_9PROT|nr:hypothetical protein [Pelagibius litoralis]NIA67803.1 hypothetical protein [Pelagibius litoralis]
MINWAPALFFITLVIVATGRTSQSHAIDITDFEENGYFAGLVDPSPEDKALLSPWKMAYYKDHNNDGKFTISEAWEWIKDTFFFPGYTVVWLLWGTVAGVFFEITPHSFQGGISGTLSMFAWGLAWLIAAVIFSD